MAGYSSAPALISICVVLCLSALGDCRIVLDKEEVVGEQGKVGEKERSVHLLLFLPSEKESRDGITRDAEPLPDLRGKDGIFEGERRGRFRFGCHHGRFKHRMNEHMRFPFEFPGGRPHSMDLHPRAEEFWRLRKESGFDCDFSNGHRHEHGHGHKYWHELRHGNGHGYGEDAKEERRRDAKDKLFKTE